MREKEKIKIITWNINSIRKRLPLVEELIQERKPDFVFLQETKIMDSLFPQVLNYHVYPSGEKGKNGVVILSKHECEEAHILNYLGRLKTIKYKNTFLSCLYMYNGFSVSSPKEKKMEMFKWMHSQIENLEDQYIVAGDFNVMYKQNEATIEIPYEADEIAVYKSFEKLFTDTTPNEQFITWWDYRTPVAWNKGFGIDKFYLKNLDQFTTPKILKHYRFKEQTSDHAPVEIIIEI